MIPSPGRGESPPPAGRGQLGDLASRLRRGELLIGTFVMELPQRACLEALAAAGFDFAVLDLEHSATDLGRIEALIDAARAVALCSLVRVQAGDLSIVTRVLDMRPDGIMVPAVQDEDQTRAVVRACRYYPRGERGLAPLVRHLGPRFGQDDDLAVIVQIEGVAAVEHAAAVASVAGMDGVFVGPYDLSQSLGHPGQISHPEVIAAGQRVAEAVLPHARFGVYVRDATSASAWVELGASFLCLSTDGQLFLDGANSAISALKTARLAKQVANV